MESVPARRGKKSMDTRSLLFLSLEISHHLLHNELIIYANDTDTPQHGRDIENNTVVFWVCKFGVCSPDFFQYEIRKCNNGVDGCRRYFAFG